jgi:hypothetical protein
MRLGGGTSADGRWTREGCQVPSLRCLALLLTHQARCSPSRTFDRSRTGRSRAIRVRQADGLLTGAGSGLRDKQGVTLASAHQLTRLLVRPSGDKTLAWPSRWFGRVWQGTTIHRLGCVTPDPCPPEPAQRQRQARRVRRTGVRVPGTEPVSRVPATRRPLPCGFRVCPYPGELNRSGPP